MHQSIVQKQKIKIKVIKKISNIFNAIGNGVAKRDRLDAPSIK